MNARSTEQRRINPALHFTPHPSDQARPSQPRRGFALSACGFSRRRWRRAAGGGQEGGPNRPYQRAPELQVTTMLRLGSLFQPTALAAGGAPPSPEDRPGMNARSTEQRRINPALHFRPHPSDQARPSQPRRGFALSACGFSRRRWRRAAMRSDARLCSLSLRV